MRSAGLPIEVLIEYVALVQKGDKTIEARKEILIEQREVPTLTMWIGTFLTLLSGMYILYREQKERRVDMALDRADHI